MNKRLKYIISMFICACVMSLGFLLYAYVVSHIDLEYIGDAFLNVGLNSQTVEFLIGTLSFLVPILSMTAVGVITYVFNRKSNLSSLALKSKVLTVVESALSCAFYFFWGLFGFVLGILNIIRAFAQKGVSVGFEESIQQGLGFLLYVLGWLAFPIAVSTLAMLTSELVKLINRKIGHKKALCVIIEVLVCAVVACAILVLSFFAFRFLFLGTDNYFTQNAG